MTMVVYVVVIFIPNNLNNKDNINTRIWITMQFDRAQRRRRGRVEDPTLCVRPCKRVEDPRRLVKGYANKAVPRRGTSTERPSHENKAAVAEPR